MSGREAQREQEHRCYARKRIGAILTPVPVTPAHRAALLRSGLISGDDDRQVTGWAFARLLDAVAPLAALGEAIFPTER